jgi:hypothetical protein
MLRGLRNPTEEAKALRLVRDIQLIKFFAAAF